MGRIAPVTGGTSGAKALRAEHAVVAAKAATHKAAQQAVAERRYKATDTTLSHRDFEVEEDR